MRRLKRIIESRNYTISIRRREFQRHLNTTERKIRVHREILYVSALFIKRRTPFQGQGLAQETKRN